METTRTTTHVATSVGPSAGTDARSSEWDAAALRPVAHWVLMPADPGRSRLEMVWEIPDPIASSAH
jgi:hypothetical protein